jgi:AAA domain
MQPAALAEFLERQITEHHLGVLFVDHLQNLVRVADSNDYAVVSNALEPFAAVARRTGCALILLHHLPKSPREDGEIDAMGSEAYRGAADCFIESTRSNGRYFIRAEARGGGLLPRMVLTLDRETGIVSGINALDAERVELEGRILEHLKAVGEPVPGPELREALGTRSKILFEALENLVETEKVDRSGEGKKKHPHIYQISTFRHSPSTGNANVESAGTGGQQAPTMVERIQHFDISLSWVRQMSNLKTCNPPDGHKQKYCSRVPGTKSLETVPQKTHFSPSREPQMTQMMQMMKGQKWAKKLRRLTAP